ncbi:MAG: protein-L-isoaspartate O-methyltransferase [Rhodobacteraceae bacterium]|jgi:protein-L-isoaspartate(D-aspartate) O-methyltransferase|nr:protein-L-isoaspartate O-methyltransferase [Paracoccaceae bacterium]
MTDFPARRRTMVDTQVRPSDVTKYPIIEAMLDVPRELFVPAGRREAAYIGENIPLAPGRVILEPRTLAKMLDALDIRDDELVLVLGAGLGYSAAVVSHLAEAVVAVEEDDDMVREADGALAEIEADNVAVVHAPLAEGAAKHGPYDVILIDGAVEELPPAVAAQLKDGGRIACLFVEGALGVCRIGYRADGGLTWRSAFNAAAPVLPGFARRREFVL